MTMPASSVSSASLWDQQGHDSESQPQLSTFKSGTAAAVLSGQDGHEVCWWPGQTTVTKVYCPCLSLYFPGSQSLYSRSQPRSVRTPSLSHRLRHTDGLHREMWPKPFHRPEAHTAHATQSGVVNDLAQCLLLYHQYHPWSQPSQEPLRD